MTFCGFHSALDGSHPEEQGLKPFHEGNPLALDGLDGSHPEEQGLKQAFPPLHHCTTRLDGSHPEEQGLKLSRYPFYLQLSDSLMGVIQKNKD